MKKYVCLFGLLPCVYQFYILLKIHWKFKRPGPDNCGGVIWSITTISDLCEVVMLKELIDVKWGESDIENLS